MHSVLTKTFLLMLPHNYSYESYDSIACSSLTWQGIVTTILHLWMINPVVISLGWDLLFRNCNSNISSCTISNNIEYHVCGFHIVQMSIFQLSGFPYKYDDSYLTVIFSTSLYIMSHVSYHGLTLIIVRTCKLSCVFLYTLDSN